MYVEFMARVCLLTVSDRERYRVHDRHPYLSPSVTTRIEAMKLSVRTYAMHTVCIYTSLKVNPP